MMKGELGCKKRCSSSSCPHDDDDDDEEAVAGANRSDARQKSRFLVRATDSRNPLLTDERLALLPASENPTNQPDEGEMREGNRVQESNEAE